MSFRRAGINPPQIRPSTSRHGPKAETELESVEKALPESNARKEANLVDEAAKEAAKQRKKRNKFAKKWNGQQK